MFSRNSEKCNKGGHVIADGILLSPGAPSWHFPEVLKKKKKGRTFPLFGGVSERFTAKPILLFFLFVKYCKIDSYLAGEIHLNSYLKAM